MLFGTMAVIYEAIPHSAAKLSLCKQVLLPNKMLEFRNPALRFTRLSNIISRPGEHWRPEAGNEQVYIARCKTICSTTTPGNVDRLSFQSECCSSSSYI